MLMLVLLVCSYIHYVCAQIRFVTPATTDSMDFTAISFSWEESNTGIPLEDITNTVFYICSGSMDAPQPCAVLYTSPSPSSISQAGPFAISQVFGPAGRLYFLWAQSTYAGGIVNDYTDFFTVNGLTGTFDNYEIYASLMALGVYPYVPTLTGFSTFLGVWPTGTMRDWYLSQTTGVLRTGPIQNRPDSTFTAATTDIQPLWETSSYSVFTTFAGPPIATSTVFASPTYMYTLYANYASTASKPTIIATPTVGLRRRDSWAQAAPKRGMRLGEHKRGLLYS